MLIQKKIKFKRIYFWVKLAFFRLFNVDKLYRTKSSTFYYLFLWGRGFIFKGRAYGKQKRNKKKKLYFNF